MQKETLGMRVKALRKNKKLTQMQLANKLYISESYIALIEADKRNPSMEIVSKLADFFCVTSDFLINGEIPDQEVLLVKELTELTKGRSDAEIRSAINIVRAFFECVDNSKQKDQH